ncbi:MAG: EscU/YscU/HrcU family type III secretion system export apparatus switch protein [Verrucomicrobiota bacterium]
MANHPSGEKTEQPTPRRLEEAIKRGQFARSAEVQTVFVLLGGLIAFKFVGADLWQQLVTVQTSILGHLHEIPLSFDVMQAYAIRAALLFAACAGPILIGTTAGGLVAGGIQNRFQTASEALEPKWDRLNPAEGFKRVFSGRSLVPTGVSIMKLAVVAGLTYSQVKTLLADPIFYTPVGVSRFGAFIAQAAFGITWRVVLCLAVIAALDYTYQFWRTNRDLMMTKEEVKEEMKNSEGNPQMKARQRRRRAVKTVRQMLLDVPKADVVVTNPTHFAIALRYDRKTMKAPRIVAKGTRLNALRIREIATRNQVPLVENKPLARMMFKYGKVGGEIPAQLYAAVAEILAYVYRINRYRYYAEQNHV